MDCDGFLLDFFAFQIQGVWTNILLVRPENRAVLHLRHEKIIQVVQLLKQAEI